MRELYRRRYNLHAMAIVNSKYLMWLVRPRFWREFVGFLCMFGLMPLMAQEQANTERSIEQIAQQIQSVTEQLNSSKMKLRSERSELQKTETAIAASRQQLRRLSQKAKDEQRKLDQTQVQINQITADSVSIQQQLRALLLAQYKQGGDHYIKQLLNQENPYALGRLHHYRDRCGQAMMDQLDEYKLIAHALNEQKQLYLAQQGALNATRSEIQSRQSTLRQQRHRRQAAIASLDSQMSEQSSQLQQLDEDRKRLQSLLQDIQRQAEAIKVRPLATRQALVPGGFLRQKGRLGAPVEGRIAQRFGQRQTRSGLNSNGVLFEAASGQAVRSIFRGHVIFSDYLKGFGLLLIVDHGDDHISLYGHNSRLLKQVGQFVEAQEVIAEVGNSGGLKTSALYFELRHKAQPIDPLIWLSE